MFHLAHIFCVAHLLRTELQEGNKGRKLQREIEGVLLYIPSRPSAVINRRTRNFLRILRTLFPGSIESLCDDRFSVSKWC